MTTNAPRTNRSEQPTRQLHEAREHAEYGQGSPTTSSFFSPLHILHNGRGRGRIGVGGGVDSAMVDRVAIGFAVDRVGSRIGDSRCADL